MAGMELPEFLGKKIGPKEPPKLEGPEAGQLPDRMQNPGKAAG